MYTFFTLIGACFIASTSALPVEDLCTQPYIEHLHLCLYWAQKVSHQLANYSVVLDECWSTHLPKLQSTSVSVFYDGLNIYLKEVIRLNSTKFSYVTANNNEAQFAKDYISNLRQLTAELHQAVDSLGVQTTPTTAAPVVASSEKSSAYVYTDAWRTSSSLRAALVEWKAHCLNRGQTY